MAKKTFFNTPWGERGAVERIALIGGGAIALFVGYKFFKNIGDLYRTTRGKIQAGAELGVLETKNILPNYTATQYNIMAEQLYVAMKNYWYSYGTDEDSIKAVMVKMKNDADVLKLIQAYGNREGYDLSGWLRDDMSDEYMEEYVNGPLRANGVTFQF